MGLCHQLWLESTETHGWGRLYEKEKLGGPGQHLIDSLKGF